MMKPEIVFAFVVAASIRLSAGDDFKQLCNPFHAVTHDENFCRCELAHSSVIGRPSIKIDCMLSEGVINLTNEYFKAENLPLNTFSLILSYQSFTAVPFFIGDLRELDMSNNHITIVKQSNFADVRSLERLDLSYNRIAEVETNAFATLKMLHHLDLSNNLLHIVPAHTFEPLITLHTLKLSGNEGFGRIMGRNATNSSLAKIYLQLGVSIGLKSLEMERCNVSTINLMDGQGLDHVNLGYNEIVDVSKLELPAHIKKLELSGNPVKELSSYALSNIYNLHELIMEDMPFLGRVEEYSLYALSKLQHLSLEGSKNLSFFHPQAFDVETHTHIDVKILNLRGCNLRILNSSLKSIFDGLDELHLDGNPFNCDCDLQWMKEIEVKTDFRCNKPEEHNGKLFSELSEKELKCSKMSRFMKKLVNSLILLTLLIGCSLAIWCFFRQLSPKGRRKELQKVGPESPYQRVTIEPNRAEYSLH